MKFSDMLGGAVLGLLAVATELRYDTTAMHVHVLYFAIVRERLRRDSDELVIGDPVAGAAVTVAMALARLCEIEPQVASILGACRVALNQEFVDSSAVLAEGDELAIIPPVAGGSAEVPVAARPYVALLATPLSVDRCVAAVSYAGAGATCVFVGHVRDANRGERIVRLDYSAYDAMAVGVMRKLCAAIALEIPGAHLAVEHRIGTLAVGDYAVVIAASAPHRAEAFAACRALIERLKQEVPIWKKEFGENGAEWIGMGP